MNAFVAHSISCEERKKNRELLPLRLEHIICTHCSITVKNEKRNTSSFFATHAIQRRLISNSSKVSLLHSQNLGVQKNNWY